MKLIAILTLLVCTMFSGIAADSLTVHNETGQTIEVVSSGGLYHVASSDLVIYTSYHSGNVIVISTSTLEDYIEIYDFGGSEIRVWIEVIDEWLGLEALRWEEV